MPHLAIQQLELNWKREQLHGMGGCPTHFCDVGI